jgi:hypothetical protein
MKRMIGPAIVAALAIAATALAADRALFIKSKDTKLLKDASFTAKQLSLLQPGTEVMWKGADAKEKTLHKVVAGGKEGYVLQANLSPNKPAEEVLTGDGKPVSAQAVASSGAATKALTPAALKYANEKGPTGLEAACEIIYLEEHNKNEGKPAAIAAHKKSAGLPGGAD